VAIDEHELGLTILFSLAQHLSHEELKEAIALTCKTLDDNGFQNVLVIAGTGAQSARETKKLCIGAKEARRMF